MVYPAEQGASVVRHWRNFVSDIPDELTVWIVSITAPPFPFLPESYHGTPILFVIPVYVGELEKGKSLIEPLRQFGDPIADIVKPRPYKQWQQFFDDAFTPGARNYWKSHNFSAFTDPMIDTMMEYAQNRPSPQTKLVIDLLGGATSRVPSDATAYPHRDTQFIVNIVSRWEKPEMDDECIGWTRDCYDALSEYSTRGTYVNFISEEAGEEELAYRDNYQQLVELKKRYDPDNFFQMNQNIQPDGSGP